jgi:purine nucleoside phosphorylase
MKEFAASVAGFPLRLRCLRMGDDICLTLSGGEREHIGAAAVAQPRPSLADPARTSATASVITLAGHKEDILARELSLKVAGILSVTVCVACGIHIRNPTQAVLEEMVAASHRLVDDFLAEMQKTVKS